jgi:hypothetical protein
MTIRLNGSTSGYTEIDAPAVAGSNTLVLPTGAGSAYQVVRNGATAGSLEFTDKIVSGTAVASTSGTSIDFTGLPSWVKRVTVMFSGVSLATFNSESNSILVRLGSSGGVETSSYTQSSSFVGINSGVYFRSDGFHIATWSVAANTVQGALTFVNLSGNTWSCSGAFNHTAGYTVTTAGVKTLSGTLDRVRITTVNGTDTFDAGSINLLWE